MKKYLLLTFLIISVHVSSWSQSISFQENARIDTLFLALKIAPGTSPYLKQSFRADMDSIVGNFNKQNKLFYLIIDSTVTNSALSITTSEVDYVNKKRNIIFTAVNMALISSSVYLYYRTSILFPLLVFPSANLKVTATLSPDVSGSEKGAMFNASGNGFWLKKEKQDLRLRGAFEDSVVKILKRTHKHYWKMRKKQARNPVEEEKEKRRPLL